MLTKAIDNVKSILGCFVLCVVCARLSCLFNVLLLLRLLLLPFSPTALHCIVSRYAIPSSVEICHCNITLVEHYYFLLLCIIYYLFHYLLNFFLSILLKKK